VGARGRTRTPSCCPVLAARRSTAKRSIPRRRWTRRRSRPEPRPSSASRVGGVAVSSPQRHRHGHDCRVRARSASRRPARHAAGHSHRAGQPPNVVHAVDVATILPGAVQHRRRRARSRPCRRSRCDSSPQSRWPGQEPASAWAVDAATSHPRCGDHHGPVRRRGARRHAADVLPGEVTLSGQEPISTFAVTTAGISVEGARRLLMASRRNCLRMSMSRHRSRAVTLMAGRRGAGGSRCRDAAPGAVTLDGQPIVAVHAVDTAALVVEPVTLAGQAVEAFAAVDAAAVIAGAVTLEGKEVETVAHVEPAAVLATVTVAGDAPDAALAVDCSGGAAGVVTLDGQAAEALMRSMRPRLRRAASRWMGRRLKPSRRSNRCRDRHGHADGRCTEHGAGVEAAALAAGPVTLAGQEPVVASASRRRRSKRRKAARRLLLCRRAQVSTFRSVFRGRSFVRMCVGSSGWRAREPSTAP